MTGRRRLAGSSGRLAAMILDLSSLEGIMSKITTSLLRAGQRAR
jgi:hypothetical protein